MKTKTRFAWKQFLKNLAIIAIPVALQNMLTTTGSMIDTMMIAPLGETTVGAVGLCAQFSSLMFAGYWGFFGGGMLFFSQYWGAQDDDGIDHSYGLTLTCMMIVGLTFGAFAIFAPETVMKLYTDKENIQVIGAEYLRIIGFGYPVQVFSMAMSALLRSTERVRIPLSRQSPRWHRIFSSTGCSFTESSACRRWACAARRWQHLWRRLSTFWSF